MMTEVKHLEADELEAGLEDILQSPKDHGVVKMIVRRPDVDHREVLEEAELDFTEGLVGDNWRRRGSGSTPDGSAHPEMQLNIMNARVIALVAASRERWSLAGDQFYIDLDLTKDNLPPGSQLELGTAIVEIPSVPHLGCKKFAMRFGWKPPNSLTPDEESSSTCVVSMPGSLNPVSFGLETPPESYREI